MIPYLCTHCIFFLNDNVPDVISWIPLWQWKSSLLSDPPSWGPDWLPSDNCIPSVRTFLCWTKFSTNLYCGLVSPMYTVNVRFPGNLYDLVGGVHVFVPQSITSFSFQNYESAYTVKKTKETQCSQAWTLWRPACTLLRFALTLFRRACRPMSHIGKAYGMTSSQAPIAFCQLRLAGIRHVSATEGGDAPQWWG